MSSYRGAGAAWDGGPPGAEAEYAGQRAPAPSYAPPTVPGAMPTTDPWTGVSYSQYGATPGAYDYQNYGTAATGYGYNYDANYYQRPDGGYYGKYSDSRPYSQQPHSAYEYPTRYREKSRSPINTQRYEPRRSYHSKSRSVSPYTRKGREGSFEERRRRRSRSGSSKRKKYSSSDRSSSRSYSSSKRPMKKRNSSSESSGSDRSLSKRSRKNRGHNDSTPRGSRSSSSRGRTPSLNRSISKSPNPKTKIVKSHSRKDRQREMSTPQREKKEQVKSPKRQIKTERLTLTPPKVYKLKGRRSDTPTRDRSSTTHKTHGRSGSSSSSNSHSRSPSPRRSKHKRSHSSSRSSRSRSSSRSGSSTPPRRSKHKSSISHSNRRSRSKSRSNSGRRSKSRGKTKGSMSPRNSKSRSRSHSRTPSDDERRGQFTVADRKRFWKLHNNRQGEKEKEPKTPPKEVKPPPPGAVAAATKFDDIEYGDPPEVEGPNFAELLPPPDQVMQASSSKSKPLPIPIKNDGSFLEMFKKMQEVTKKDENTIKKPEIKKPVLPFIGKRRGGRVLKTGLVKKAKAIDEQSAESTPKDAWSLYMQEVKKYRETSCEEERKTRPLVK